MPFCQWWVVQGTIPLLLWDQQGQYWSRIDINIIVKCLINLRAVKAIGLQKFVRDVQVSRRAYRGMDTRRKKRKNLKEGKETHYGLSINRLPGILDFISQAQPLRARRSYSEDYDATFLRSATIWYLCKRRQTSEWFCSVAYITLRWSNTFNINTPHLRCLHTR